MAVRIRLRRVGAKGQPHYRIVVADGRAPRDGSIVEAIGHYNPLPAEPVIGIDEERALLWLEKGAQPSEVVRSLLARQGIMERFYQKWPNRRPKEKAQPAAAAQAQPEPAPAQEAEAPPAPAAEPEPVEAEPEQTASAAEPEETQAPEEEPQKGA